MYDQESRNGTVLLSIDWLVSGPIRVRGGTHHSPL